MHSSVSLKHHFFNFLLIEPTVHQSEHTSFCYIDVGNVLRSPTNVAHTCFLRRAVTDWQMCCRPSFSVLRHHYRCGPIGDVTLIKLINSDEKFMLPIGAIIWPITVDSRVSRRTNIRSFTSTTELRNQSVTIHHDCRSLTCSIIDEHNGGITLLAWITTSDMDCRGSW